MDKAEEKALIAYPPHSVLIQPARSGAYFADNHMRDGFIEGYHEAEKDLALTWEDIDKIMQIEDYLNRYTKIPLEGRITFCGEALRRFNELKQSK